MSWKGSRVASDGTHHISRDGTAMYEARFDYVLPFHEPGLAPVEDMAGAYHIGEQGQPAYELRFTRTFGFYQERAAVESQDGCYHIRPNGSALYHERWSWCGNFQYDRCPVFDDDGYFHIRQDGSIVPGGPWAYAGDYREGAAVVRSWDGLCKHVDMDGAELDGREFFDLDVFHKGYARARDENGWQQITPDELHPARTQFETLEPFYNGLALAQLKNGQRVVISEDGTRVHKLPMSEREQQFRLHDMSVAYWAPFAVKLGLDLGLADDQPLNQEIPKRAQQALKNAWIELGLWNPADECLTPMGERLMQGQIERDRFDYWMGPQLAPWLKGSQILRQETIPHFFNGKDEELIQKVLDSYAMQDWSPINPEILDILNINTVVDLGGGRGRLLSFLKEGKPDLNAIVVERPAAIKAMEKLPGIQYVEGDLFEGPLPPAELYLMSRVLHDWENIEVVKILNHVATEAPHESKLYFIERLAENRRHGLLDLNMYLVNCGGERTLAEWQKLIYQSPWKYTGHSMVGEYAVFDLELGDTNG